MNGKRDLVIVVLLLVALGVAWYYTGGTANPLARSGPLFTLPQQGYGIPAYVVPSVQYTPAPTDQGYNPNAVTTISNYLGTFDERPSPYSAYVTLEQSGASSGLENEYLTLRVSYNAPQKITVTGWRIESSATTIGVSLPQAAELPFLGNVNNPSTVSLSPGQTAYIITGRAPSGTSFRTNMCTGYFEQFQNFNPPLRLECPSPQDEATRALATGNYTQGCYDVVRTLGRCTLTFASIPVDAGSACQSFIQDTLTYNGCINAHKNEPKFYRDEWYLYLNRDQELWRQRSERIRLLDENGRVVDVVSY